MKIKISDIVKIWIGTIILGWMVYWIWTGKLDVTDKEVQKNLIEVSEDLDKNIEKVIDENTYTWETNTGSLVK
jgi:methionine aminopeptidase